jgi:hypothetical protein
MAIVGLVHGALLGSATGGIAAGFLRSCAIAWCLIGASQSFRGISVAQIAIGDAVTHVFLGSILGGVSGGFIGLVVGLLAYGTNASFRRVLLGISMAASSAAGLAWCVPFGLLLVYDPRRGAQATSAGAAMVITVAAAAGGLRLGRKIADAAWKTREGVKNDVARNRISTHHISAQS